MTGRLRSISRPLQSSSGSNFAIPFAATLMFWLVCVRKAVSQPSRGQRVAVVNQFTETLVHDAGSATIGAAASLCP